MGKMNCEVRFRDSVADVTISGAVFEREAEALREYFLALSGSPFREVVIDMGGLTHIGGAGIGKILLLYKRLLLSDGNLRLVRVPEPIHGIFREMHLDRLFEVYPMQ